jgi:uncharacterized protein YndB with AHSA1/START domain
VTIAPVCKSVRVKASQAHAFEVFTAGLDCWWPRKGTIGTSPLKTVTIEPRLGGRWYETGEDGSEATVGKILLWEPPNRFIVSWDINHRWKPTTVGSEVSAVHVEGPSATGRAGIQEFERMEAEGSASLRKDVDSGWPASGGLPRGSRAVISSCNSQQQKGEV